MGKKKSPGKVRRKNPPPPIADPAPPAPQQPGPPPENPETPLTGEAMLRAIIREQRGLIRDLLEIHKVYEIGIAATKQNKRGPAKSTKAELEWAKAEIERHGRTWDDVGDDLGISGGALRLRFWRAGVKIERGKKDA
jgi:hypothetical protein